MRKLTYLILSLFLLISITTITACATGNGQDLLEEDIKVVGSVPQELTHWLHSQLGLQKNPMIISNDLEDHVYILVTMGSRSVEDGMLTLSEQKRNGNKVYLEIVYEYQGGAGESLDTHFLILKAQRDLQLEIELIDGITQSSLGAYGRN